MKHFWLVILSALLGVGVVFGVIYWDRIEIVFDDVQRYIERVNNEAEDSAAESSEGV